MGRINKRFKLMIIFLCLILLYGCDKIRLTPYKANDDTINKEKQIEEDQEVFDDTNSSQQKTDPNPTDTEVNKTNETDQVDDITPTLSNIQPIANTELLIYTVNVDTVEIQAVTTVVQDKNEISPELIVTEVEESMADQLLYIGVESVIVENNYIVVNFLSDQPPLSGVGGGMEAAILNAIAQSLMDNLSEYKGVIYRNEGKAYVSGHIELGIDEVYLGD